MLPDNIDDLFRDKLDGHETPPGDALWARLQAAPAAGEPATAAPNAERLDQLFQKGLHAHATPPGRALWERLEDEHLRPRKRRAAAWWPMALAAAVALLLVAGGTGLWLGFPFGNPAGNTVASHQKQVAKPTDTIVAEGLAAAATKGTGTTEEKAAAAGSAEAVSNAALAANSAAQTQQTTAAAAIQKNNTVQATRPAALASTLPKTRMAAPGQSPRHLKGTTRQPDAATANAQLVARTTAHAATRPARSTAADEQRQPAETTPTVALAPTPKPVPAPEIVPTGAVSAPSLASSGELITVDVRNGAAPAARPTKITTSALALADAPADTRRLGGRLLQQAGHLMRGERLSLAEVTGLPENVTLRATVAGRSVTKSIQL